MRNSVFISFFWIVFALLPGTGFTQIQRGGELQNEPESSQLAKKQIKPKIGLYHLNGFGAFKDSTQLDTIQDFFHLYHPVDKNTISASYLGNYATPYIDNDFFNRETDMDFFFLQSRNAYLLTPNSVKYYDTKTPYTLLDYTQSEHRTRKNETRFNVLHTQNVNPFLNFTFRYDQARSAGQYKSQDSKNNFITLYANYNKDKLAVHGGFISNHIFNNENGGIHDDADLLREPETDFLDVNLTSAKTEFGNKYFFATGEYRFGKTVEIATNDSALDVSEPMDSIPVPVLFKPVVGILYSFEYQSNFKEYTDEEGSFNDFYAYDYYGEDYIKDSIRFRKLSNIIQLKQYENPERKTSFGKRVYIGQEFIHASSPGTDELFINNLTKRYSNVYAGGGIFRQTGSFWRWNFDGRLFLLGRNIGQTEISGMITKPLSLLHDSLSALTISGKIENRVPDYFQQEYYSKRIRWQNDLKMEQRMTVGGVLKFPSRKFELSANYAIINNFIYNDTLAVPAQYSGQLLVFSAYADKDFQWRSFHLRTRLLWQKASNENVLHLPDFSTYLSGYYKFVISKVMFTQLGLDVRYNSRYYADAYFPATGMFYLQNTEKIGNFPYMDAYASLRLKRTRVFFKLINFGTEFVKREYFTTPGYPMNRMTFRLGVAWAFYD